MKKIILAVFLIALMVLVIAGCGNSDVVDESGKKVGEIKTTRNADGSETTTTTIDLTENVEEGQPCEYDGQCGAFSDMKACKNGRCVDIECKFLSDCDGDADLCLQGKCMTDAELKERFEFWELNSRCQGSCDACLTGEFKSSMVGGTGTDEYRLCLDCMSDIDCKEGYWCDVGKCMRSDGSAPVAAEREVEDDAPENVDVEAAPVDRNVGSGEPILGEWDKGGFHYYFKENGDMMLADSGVVKGTWEHVEGNRYSLYWSNYKYFDDVVLSEDGNMLTGNRRGTDKDVEIERLA